MTWGEDEGCLFLLNWYIEQRGQSLSGWHGPAWAATSGCKPRLKRSHIVSNSRLFDCDMKGSRQGRDKKKVYFQLLQVNKQTNKQTSNSTNKQINTNAK